MIYEVYIEMNQEGSIYRNTLGCHAVTIWMLASFLASSHSKFYYTGRWADTFIYNNLRTLSHTHLHIERSWKYVQTNSHLAIMHIPIYQFLLVTSEHIGNWSSLLHVTSGGITKSQINIKVSKVVRQSPTQI